MPMMAAPPRARLFQASWDILICTRRDLMSLGDIQFSCDAALPQVFETA